MSYYTNVGFILKLWAYRKCFDAYYYIFYSIQKEKKNLFVFVSVVLDFTFILVSELQLNC